MVVFTSLIGAVAIYARVASAVPMDYGSSSGYGASSGSGYGSSSPPANSYGSGSYGSGSGNNDTGSNSYVASSSTSMAMAMSTTPPAAYPASTPASSPSYSPPSYGSGSSSWSSGSEYNNCVQQCMAQYPSSMNPGSPPPPPPSNSGSGSGVTHTVIVAPTQGVLRYVPFALNASVGDTVMFMWGANNHTVTKSSELELCNKTTDAPFASGEQNKSFMFSQVVNDTNPTFYYCGTPTHCEKGMFGIINPPNAYNTPSSLSSMTGALASQNPSTNASMSYSTQLTANNSAAANWGNNIDMSQMPQWAQPYVAENAMYARAFFAANPGTLDASGNVDMSSVASGNANYPEDVAATFRNNNAESSTPSSSATSSSASPTSSGDPSGALSKNGAGALASPRIVVALVAVAAAFFAL